MSVFYKPITSEAIRVLLQDINPALLAKFIRYNNRNPHIYPEFVQNSMEMYTSGRAKYSAWAVINKMRWDHDISTTGDMFKISNDYIALFSRLTMRQYTELEGFFDTKTMVSPSTTVVRESA